MDNKIKKVIISGALGLSVATTMFVYANVEGDSYGGVQYGLGTYDEDGYDDANPNLVVGRYGKFINDTFAIEGRIGFGIEDDTVDIPTVGDVKMEVDTIIGVYGSVHVALNDSSSVYGLLGFSRGELTASIPAMSSSDYASNGFSRSDVPTTIPGFTYSDDDSSLSYGIGANVSLSDTLALNVEYIQYLSASDYAFTAIGLGVVFSFE